MQISYRLAKREDKHMRPWVIFVAGMYAGAALVTLGFQTWVRLSNCYGVWPCMISLAKGVVWSAIWPASWLVLFWAWLG